MAILSYEFWKSHFAADSTIVGKDIHLDDLMYTVIGVTPPQESVFGSSVMIPLQADLANPDRTQRDLWVIVRLNAGISWEQADVRLNDHARAIEREYGSKFPEYTGLQLQFWNGYEANIGGVRPGLTILLVAVGVLLLICCANVGGLLLARVAARRREFALRVALGARTGRVLRQMLTETLTLACAAGIAGVCAAYLSLPILVRLIPSSWITVDPTQIAVNFRMLVFSMAVTVTAGLMFGSVPAWAASRSDLTGILAEGGTKASTGRRGSWIRDALVVAQIALTLVVLVGATLAIESYRRSARVDLGFQPERVLSFQIALPSTKYPLPRQIGSFFQQAVRRLQSLPGVEGAAIVSGLPMLDRTVDLSTQDFTIEGWREQNGEQVANANYRLVSPGYFDVMGARLARGRLFGEQDEPGSAPVIIVNQTMADRFWPHAEPLGQKVHLTHPLIGVGRVDAEPAPVLTVVGVVGDIKQIRVIDAPVRPEFYLPHLQFANLGRVMTVMVRSRLGAAQLTSAVRRSVMSIDAQQPISDVRTMEQVVSDSFGTARITTVLLTFFAAVALPLAAMGLYALISYSISLRVREVGLRQALGAQPGQVLKLLMRDGVRLALVGVVLGLSIAVALARVMFHSIGMFSNIDPTNPIVFGAVSLFIVVIALIACFVPATRALRMDPTAALRHD